MDAEQFLACVSSEAAARFYCYVLRRPSGDPFYVGIGRGARALHHERRAYQARVEREHKSRLIRKIHAAGMSVVYEFVGSYADRGDAEARERELIQKFGRMDLRSGILVNRTSGGDGAPEHKLSDAAKASISRHHKGKIVSEATRKRLSEIAKRRMADPVKRQRLTEAGSRYSRNPENRPAMAARTKSKWTEPDFRKNVLTAKVGVWTDERREAMSSTIRELNSDPARRASAKIVAEKYWESPEYRSKHKAAVVRAMNDPGMREKIKIGVGRANATDATRKAKSDAAKARWADPIKRATLLKQRSAAEAKI